MNLVLQDPAKEGLSWQSSMNLSTTIPCPTNQSLVAMVDINRDSLPDVVVACSDSPNVTVFLNVSE